MVSEDIQNYKSNTKGYYPSHSTTPANAINLAAANRFVDNSLRPWPPMYRAVAGRNQMATYQPLGSASSNKLNANTFNGNQIGYGNSIYGQANNFNLHQFDMAAAPVAIDGKYPSTVNSANMKNARNYLHMLQLQYGNNTVALPTSPAANGNTGSVYGRAISDDRPINGNMQFMLPDRDKSRFRRLRNPTQISQPLRSSCATCIRSKSMEDVRTDIVIDWPTYNKENYNEFKRNRLNYGVPLSLLKPDMRRSMDNLLEVQTTNFGKRFQVGHNNHYQQTIRAQLFLIYSFRLPFSLYKI